MLGATFDCRSKFKVRIVCGNSSSHWFIGKLLSTPAKTEMKCPLKVWIAHSAAFCLRWSTGVNSTLHLFSQIACFNSFGASLLSMCRSPGSMHVRQPFWLALIDLVRLALRWHCMCLHVYSKPNLHSWPGCGRFRSLCIVPNKGRHVRNTEVDGMARARAAAGRRGLRSSPSAAIFGGGCGDDGRWGWALMGKGREPARRRWQVRADADGQGTRARGWRQQARADADGQGMRAGVTTTAGRGCWWQRMRAGAAANNDGILLGIIAK